MLDQVVFKSVVELFNKEIQLATRVEILKQKTALCYDFDSKTIYGAIDDCAVGFIDSQSLKRFFAKFKLYPTDGVILAMIRRLDLDADSRLNKREFIDGILPQESYSKGSIASLKENKIKKPFTHTASYAVAQIDNKTKLKKYDQLIAKRDEKI